MTIQSDVLHMLQGNSLLIALEFSLCNEYKLSFVIQVRHVNPLTAVLMQQFVYNF